MSLMLNNGTALTARETFERGSALVQQGRYEQALPELLKAEALFRQIDARGHPFTRPLANGISGLANTLFLTGLCHQKLGNYHQAVQHYESSYINSKFEKPRHFKIFSRSVNEDLLACYEKMLAEGLQERAGNILNSDPAIDTSYLFPLSLDRDAAVLARLFELSPGRFEAYRPFYLRAKKKDNELRKREKKSDDASMKKRSFLIWSVLIIIWAIYGLFVIDSLFQKK